MTAASPVATSRSNVALAERPAPVRRSADWMVVGLVAAALLGGWALRERVLYAGDTVTVQGLRMAIPSGSIPSGRGDTFGVVTPDGLTLRVATFPLPTTARDPLSVAAERGLEQSRIHDLYRPVATSTVTVGGYPAAVLEYAYVDTRDAAFFTSALEVVRGYELLIPHGERFQVVTLEGPQARWADVQELWPRLVGSIRFRAGAE